jgi:hypothetical protein
MDDDMVEGQGDSRKSLNLRIDYSKFLQLEQMRKTGFGFAQTERNRSDIYNEILGYGLQTQMLKQEIGDRDFERVWRLLHQLNFKKLNLEALEKLAGK